MALRLCELRGEISCSPVLTIVEYMVKTILLHPSRNSLRFLEERRSASQQAVVNVATSLRPEVLRRRRCINAIAKKITTAHRGVEWHVARRTLILNHARFRSAAIIPSNFFPFGSVGIFYQPSQGVGHTCEFLMMF